MQRKKTTAKSPFVKGLEIKKNITPQWWIVQVGAQNTSIEGWLCKSSPQQFTYFRGASA